MKTEREKRLEDALSMVLPMAKGYAYEHPFGGNQGKCVHAERVLSDEGSGGSGECPECGGSKVTPRHDTDPNTGDEIEVGNGPCHTCRDDRENGECLRQELYHLRSAYYAAIQKLQRIGVKSVPLYPDSEPADNAVADFIEDLCGELLHRGIDTSNWDGDAGPADAIANGIQSAIEEAAEPAVPEVGVCLDRAHREHYKKTGEQCTCPKYVRDPRCDRHEIRTFKPAAPSVPDGLLDSLKDADRIAYKLWKSGFRITKADSFTIRNAVQQAHDALQSIGQHEETPAETVLRSLASWLGVGGYNAPTVDPEQFEVKIREGVETLVRVEKERAAAVPEAVVVAVRDRLRADENQYSSDAYEHRCRDAFEAADKNEARAEICREIADELDRALAQHGERVPDESLQPIIVDKQGVVRFRRNEIVSFLLDAGPFDMNQLARMPFNDMDREQFAQLIGYSVSGFGDLSYASEKTVRRADSIANMVAAEPDGKGD